MKMLDEVITALEICSTHLRCDEVCPYHKSGCIEYEMEKDALHYLREYREKQAITDALPDYYELVNFWAEQQENNPLTWDELKGMEGKPVWVEVDENWYGKFWAFVEVENDAYVNFYQKGQEYPEDLWKRNMGKTWNVFRKERS